MEDFNEDLSIALTEVRNVLDHWGLKDWREYLVVRRPARDGSYIVLANPNDKSDFQESLVEFHKKQVECESMDIADTQIPSHFPEER